MSDGKEDYSSESDFHGWTIKTGKKETTVHIGNLPGRKSVCLYEDVKYPWTDESGKSGVGGYIQPLAYFRDEESAKKMLSFIDSIIDQVSQ